MKYYTVEQVSKAIGKSPETVRRLLRNGEGPLAVAKPTTSKSGWKIPEDALKKFLATYPKYMTDFARDLLSPSSTLPLLIGGIIGGLVSFIALKGSKKVTSEMVKDHIQEELSNNEKIVKSKTNAIEKKKEEIEKKKEEIAKLQAEIDSLNLELTEAQTEVEKFSYALEELDFNEITESINKELDKKKC